MEEEIHAYVTYCPVCGHEWDFKKGDRVTLSELAKKTVYPNEKAQEKRKEGTITSFGRTAKFCAVVHWDSLKTPDSLHLDYIEKVAK